MSIRKAVKMTLRTLVGNTVEMMVTFTSILAIMKEAAGRGPGCGRGEFSIGHACKDGWLVVVTVVQKSRQQSQPKRWI